MLIFKASAFVSSHLLDQKDSGLLGSILLRIGLLLPKPAALSDAERKGYHLQRPDAIDRSLSIVLLSVGHGYAKQAFYIGRQSLPKACAAAEGRGRVERGSRRAEETETCSLATAAEWICDTRDSSIPSRAPICFMVSSSW